MDIEFIQQFRHELPENYKLAKSILQFLQADMVQPGLQCKAIDIVIESLENSQLLL